MDNWSVHRRRRGISLVERLVDELRPFNYILYSAKIGERTATMAK